MSTLTARISYFDNARFALIFLVVLGHTLEVFKNQYFYTTVYTFIYSFHMPMFSLISGYFSKADQSSVEVKKKIYDLLIPFLIFQILYTLALEVFRGAPISTLLIPNWHLWFILSLFYWRAMIPYIAKVKYITLFAFIMAIAFGYIETPVHYLGIEQTITFLPFFLIGFYLPNNFHIKITILKYKLVGLIILIVGAIMINYYIESFNYNWFYGIVKYKYWGYKDFNGVLVRIIAYFVSLLLGFSFLTLIPMTNIELTSLGQNTLCVYLWHGFVLNILHGCGVLAYIFNKSQPFIAPLIFTSIAILITLILSSKLIVSFTDYFISGFRIFIIKTTRS
jgi:fucose 4-O-acetylase-like acetyltransferase